MAYSWLQITKKWLHKHLFSEVFSYHTQRYNAWLSVPGRMEKYERPTFTKKPVGAQENLMTVANMEYYAYIRNM
jgi:hypothetical protein